MSEVTRILHAIEEGDSRAADALLPLVFEELRMLAAQKLSQEKPGQTLQATALVHEVYIRLVGTEKPNWENRGHFFGAAAEAMRRILIENARRKKSAKYGGDRKRIEFDESLPLACETISVDDLLALDEALHQLAEKDQVKAELIKLCIFAGLSVEQAGMALGISRTKAYEDLAYARAWLHLAMTKGDDT